MSQKLTFEQTSKAAAWAGTATNKEFVKALWSTRGEYLLPAGAIAGFPYPVGIVKADLVNMLRTLPEDDKAGLRLVPAKGGKPETCQSWHVVQGTAPAPVKAKAKAKGKAKGTAPAAPKGEPDAKGEPGTGEPGTGEPQQETTADAGT